MLKISICESPKQRRLILEGKLIAPWAAELGTARDKASAELGGRELIVELQDITAISQEGENLLLRLMKEGVRFRGKGAFSKHLLKLLTRRTQQDSEEKG